MNPFIVSGFNHEAIPGIIGTATNPVDYVPMAHQTSNGSYLVI